MKGRGMGEQVAAARIVRASTAERDTVGIDPIRPPQGERPPIACARCRAGLIEAEGVWVDWQRGGSGVTFALCAECLLQLLDPRTEHDEQERDEADAESSRYESDQLDIHDALVAVGLDGAINADSIIERIERLAALSPAPEPQDDDYTVDTPLGPVSYPGSGVAEGQGADGG
jgi:hypothetical protein